MVVLALDTEGGGIDLDFSLLSLNLKVAEVTVDKIEVFEQGNWYLKPDDGEYLVNGEALRVNGIDLAKHDLIAIPYKEAKSQVYKFLEEAYHAHGDLWFTPMGQNVKRDVDLICHHLLARKSWQNFVDFRVLDTITVGKFLQLAGIIPAYWSLSLGKMIETAQLEESDGTLHDANYDVDMNLKLLQWYLKQLGS